MLENNENLNTKEAKQLDLAFVDKETEEITTEIEEELNKIYEDKENSGIINFRYNENLKEFLIVSLEIKEKQLLSVVPYLSNIEKECELTNKEFDNAVEFLVDSSKFRPYLYTLKNQKNSCKKIINTILSSFSKCIEKIKSNECSILEYSYYCNKIVYEFKRLSCLLETYRFQSMKVADSCFYRDLIDKLIVLINMATPYTGEFEDICSMYEYKDDDLINDDLYY